MIERNISGVIISACLQTVHNLIALHTPKVRADDETSCKMCNLIAVIDECWFEPGGAKVRSWVVSWKGSVPCCPDIGQA
jgi:hypothetical protein